MTFSPRTCATITTLAGDIPRVGTELGFADRLGSWKARWGIGRYHYRIEPGLYAVGKATHESPVFVTANYKMSFDRLRSQLGGRDGWILVLDTKGINVWCAAGKGTFGTEEIVARIQVVSLRRIVSHRTLILPQLGAPGIKAHEVQLRTGFRVLYGPVRAEDLPVFLDGGMKATTEMRRVRFGLLDRAAVVPMELIMTAKYALLAALLFFVLSGLGPGVYSTARALADGPLSAAILLVTALASATATPILLPWLPGRPFSVKGLWIGLVLAFGVWVCSNADPAAFGNRPGLIAWLLIVPAVSSFIGLGFTGASTYTSLSGVRREMQIALPLQISFAALGFGLWIAGRFV